MCDHFCACAPCRELKFSDRLMKDCFGDRMRLVNCPKLRGGVVLSQSATLAEWAGTLCEDQLVAFRVADDEQGAWGEGSVWFAVLNGVAEVLKNDVQWAGESFQKGSHVPRGYWFSFQGVVQQGSCDRRDIQVKDDAMFNVNAMIQVTGVQFSGTFRRMRKRGGRAAAIDREWVMNEEIYRSVLDST